MPVDVGVEFAAVAGSGGLHTGAPGSAAVLPAQFPRVDEYRAEEAGVLGEIEFDLAVAAGGVGIGEDLAVGGVVVVEGRTPVEGFAEEVVGIAGRPGADQFLAEEAAIPLEFGRQNGMRSPAEERTVVIGRGRRGGAGADWRRLTAPAGRRPAAARPAPCRTRARRATVR